MKTSTAILNTATGFTVKEQNYWRKKLHALRYSCGCKTGMIALLLSIAVAWYYFFYGAGIVYSTNKKVMFILLLCFGSAAAGKLIGMFWSRMKYHALKKKLVMYGLQGL